MAKYSTRRKNRNRKQKDRVRRARSHPEDFEQVNTWMPGKLYSLAVLAHGRYFRTHKSIQKRICYLLDLDARLVLGLPAEGPIDGLIELADTVQPPNP